MASTNDLKNGMVLDLDGQLWSVVWFQHHKPGKGGAMVKTTLKNVLSGKTVDKTFNAGVKVDTANVDKRTMQYLYHDGESYVFMDTETYDQIPVSDTTVGTAARFLLDNQEAIVAQIDKNTLTRIARDAVYIGVGAGVLAIQQAQVQRREVQKQLGAQLGEARQQLGTAAERIEERMKLVEERLETVEDRLEAALDSVEEQLPEQARELVQQARKAAKDARGQIRELVNRAA